MRCDGAAESKMGGAGGAILLTLLAIAGTGCGSGGKNVEVVPVTGRIFLGDQPLTFGAVTFQPVQGGQPSSGPVDKDGRFVLSTFKQADGATVGRHRVRVVAYSSQDPSNPDANPDSDALGVLLIPEKYASFTSSGLEVSVLAQGNSPFILKLEPDPPASESSEQPAGEDAVGDDSSAEEASERDVAEDDVAESDVANEDEEATDEADADGTKVEEAASDQEKTDEEPQDEEVK